MRRRKNYFKRALIISGVAFLLFAVSSLPVFHITHIEISGNQKITDDVIKNVCGLQSTVNFFAFSGSLAKKKLCRNPYIADVEVQKKFPDTISLTIEERRVSGYVQDVDGYYLYIDHEGRVLEVSKTFVERLPVVVGLSLKDFDIGQVLPVKNKSAFRNVVELASLFEAYGLQEDVIRVDVSKEEDIRLYVYQLDVEFGDITDAEQKIQVLKQSLEAIPNAKTVRGFINLKIRSGVEEGRFRLLT